MGLVEGHILPPEGVQPHGNRPHTQSPHGNQTTGNYPHRHNPQGNNAVGGHPNRDNPVGRDTNRNGAVGGDTDGEKFSFREGRGFRDLGFWIKCGYGYCTGEF